MTRSLLPMISFVLITTFTPGPSNLSSASAALVSGYGKTILYQTGLAVGVFLLMVLSGWFSAQLLNSFPVLENVMRYVGAAYILYLTFEILRARYAPAEEDARSLGLTNGLMLQILNPKLMVYAFTLFSTFLASITTNIIFIIITAFILAGVSFCATSAWALFGTVFQRVLHNSRLKTLVNLGLSLALVYSALSLAGLI